MCPVRVEVASAPASGASLSGVSTLQLAWGNLPPNFAVNGTAFMGVGLTAVDPTTGASSELLTAPSVITLTDATLTVAAIPQPQSYRSYLKYVGVTAAVFGAGAVEAFATCGITHTTTYAN